MTTLVTRHGIGAPFQRPRPRSLAAPPEPKAASGGSSRVLGAAVLCLLTQANEQKEPTAPDGGDGSQGHK